MGIQKKQKSEKTSEHRKDHGKLDEKYRLGRKAARKMVRDGVIQ